MHIGDVDSDAIAATFNTETDRDSMAGVPQQMEETAVQNTETTNDKSQKDEKPTRTSPFTRGKDYIKKKAITIKGEMSKGWKTKLRTADSKSDNGAAADLNKNNATATNHVQQGSKGRLERQIAEGRNLSNPKIQEMIGDNDEPRKQVVSHRNVKRHTGSIKKGSLANGNRLEGPSKANAASATVDAPSPKKRLSRFNFGFGKSSTAAQTVKQVKSDTVDMSNGSDENSIAEDSDATPDNFCPPVAIALRLQPDVNIFATPTNPVCIEPGFDVKAAHAESIRLELERAHAEGIRLELERTQDSDQRSVQSSSQDTVQPDPGPTLSASEQQEWNDSQNSRGATSVEDHRDSVIQDPNGTNTAQTPLTANGYTTNVNTDTIGGHIRSPFGTPKRPRPRPVIGYSPSSPSSTMSTSSEHSAFVVVSEEQMEFYRNIGLQQKSEDPFQDEGQTSSGHEEG